MRAGAPIVLAMLAFASVFGAAAGAGRAAAAPTDAQLALMPLPLSELGPAARGLPLDPDSGVQTNSDAASDTNAPTTTATFSRLGRLTGYQLDYSDPAVSALAKGHGLIEVESDVERYRDAKAAAAGLAFERKDSQDVAPLRSSLLAASVSLFAPPSVGEAAYGVSGFLDPAGIGKLYVSEVSFRSGALIGSVSITAAAPTGLEVLAGSLARKLGRRIAAVLSGAVRGSPVPLPPGPRAARAAHGPDLAVLAVEPSDLDSATVTVTHEGYAADDDLMPLSEYVREMAPAGSYTFLESEVALFRTTAQARFTALLLIDTLASRQALSTALGTSFGGVRVSRLVVKPSRIGGSDALLVKVSLANGSALSAAFASIRDGKRMELLTVFTALDRKLSTSSLDSLVRAAAARLDGHARPAAGHAARPGTIA